jgi:hypothetical protein
LVTVLTEETRPLHEMMMGMVYHRGRSAMGQRIGRHRHLLDAKRLRNVRWWEIGVRFLAGGCISAAAAVIDHALGHKAGGAMLAFPGDSAGVADARR